MSSAVPSAALSRLDAAVALGARAFAHVVEVARDQVAVRVQGQVLQARADLRRAFAGGAQAHGFHRDDALRGEQVLRVDHAQRERRVVAGGGAHRPVVVEDREAGLLRVVEDRAARLRDRHAEHVVVVDHQPLQEQIVDLLHRERAGLGFIAAFGDVRLQELQGRLLVAVVGQDGVADAHGDRQDRRPRVRCRYSSGRSQAESTTRPMRMRSPRAALMPFM